MNIFKFELKHGKTSILKWGLSCAIVAIIYLSFFEMIKSELNAFIELLPKQLLLVFDFSQVGTFEGYFAFVMTYITLILGVQAMISGLNVYSKELRLKTADFLYTKPATRITIIIAKISSSLVIIFSTWLLFTLLVSFAAYMMNPSSKLSVLLLLCIGSFIISLLLFSFGMLFASIKTNIKNVTFLALPLTIAFYLLKTLSSVFDIKLIQYVSFFQYIDMNYITLHGQIRITELLFSILIIFVMSILSFLLFKRKDIPSV